ncbi:hypothetical protein M885DRAFT_509019 [Pelagophyceae sp. CCMP2097]|nr:hypothetical protein M885DRAFT_509019 [Pelagophyceae sp. CCMP2097]
MPPGPLPVAVAAPVWGVLPKARAQGPVDARFENQLSLCPICGEQKADQRVDCAGAHEFCAACIFTWKSRTIFNKASTSTKCPMCRAPISKVVDIRDELRAAAECDAAALEERQASRLFQSLGLQGAGAPATPVAAPKTVAHGRNIETRDFFQEHNNQNAYNSQSGYKQQSHTSQNGYHGHATAPTYGGEAAARAKSGPTEARPEVCTGVSEVYVPNRAPDGNWRKPATQTAPQTAPKHAAPRVAVRASLAPRAAPGLEPRSEIIPRPTAAPAAAPPPPSHAGPSKGLIALLENLELEKYFEALADEEIYDVETLRDLDDADLRDVGLPLGPRRKILAAIKAGLGC